MRKKAGLVVAMALVLCGVAAMAARDKGKAKGGGSGGGAKGPVKLDGMETVAWWNDGDSFRPRDGNYMNQTVRVSGYNSLETFGPVHRWGTWTPAELHDIGLQAMRLASSSKRTCASNRKRDAYGRELVTCPGLARDLVWQGLAMVLAVDDEPDPELVGMQRKAQEQRRGMWAKGVPATIITSVHSADEQPASGTSGERKPHNRVVDTQTGRSRLLRHSKTYAPCTEVCTDDKGSCLIYVPFDKQHKGAPSCLK